MGQGPLTGCRVIELAGLGPLWLFTGTRDVLNPDAHLLAAAAESAGTRVVFTEIAGQLHVYPLLPTKVGAAARDQIITALRQRTAEASRS
jgi:acetyl esterase/lipase